MIQLAQALRARLEAALDPETYQAAWERGEALELETVIHQLLAELSS